MKQFDKSRGLAEAVVAHNCPDCKGAGRILLLTHYIPCDCQKVERSWDPRKVSYIYTFQAGAINP
jgi:hypothetical protein